MGDFRMIGAVLAVLLAVPVGLWITKCHESPHEKRQQRECELACSPHVGELAESCYCNVGGKWVRHKEKSDGETSEP